jgi:ABC-type transporter Mla subunit MlaD
MPDDRIEKIKSAVEAADHIEKKTELLGLIGMLDPVIAKFAQADDQRAQNVTRLVEASAQEAARKEQRPEQLQSLLGELKHSVAEFEASHPDLVSFVTEYSAFLSALGI